ncbi:MAG TPA: hypothetical protein DD435_10655, partial [Cyanobacteria bacterium UBA8530]|nr:hypothetical protein [Cyanobacteria bacterium UBA8530]
MMSITAVAGLINIFAVAFVILVSLLVAKRTPEAFFSAWIKNHFTVLGFMVFQLFPGCEHSIRLSLVTLLFVLGGAWYSVQTADLLQERAHSRPLLLAFLLFLLGLGLALMLCGAPHNSIFIAPAIALSVSLIRLGLIFIRPVNFMGGFVAVYSIGWPLILVGCLPFFYPFFHGTPLEWIGPGTAAVLHLLGGTGMVIFILEKKGESIRALLDENLALHREQIETLKQADRLKDEFLSVIGHELRSPLAVMLGYNDILLMGSGNPEENRAYSEKIKQAGMRLRRLVDDLLEFTKLESQTMRFDFSQVDLCETVEEA